MRRTRRPTRRLSAIAALPVGAALFALTACDPDDCTGTSIGSGYTCTISGGGDSSPIPPATFPSFGGGRAATRSPRSAVAVAKSSSSAGPASAMASCRRSTRSSGTTARAWSARSIPRTTTPKPSGTRLRSSTRALQRRASRRRSLTRRSASAPPAPSPSTRPSSARPPESVFNFIPAHNGLTRLPSDDEMKAMTVLHKIGAPHRRAVPRSGGLEPVQPADPAEVLRHPAHPGVTHHRPAGDEAVRRQADRASMC